MPGKVRGNRKEQKAKRETIQLVFQRPRESGRFTAAGIPEIASATVARIEELVGWFKKFRVDSIELWIEGSVKEGKLISLFVSAEGKGGLKITLKPAEGHST